MFRLRPARPWRRRRPPRAARPRRRTRASRVCRRSAPLIDVEERLLDGLGDRAALALADRDLVDRPDRRDFDRRAHEEGLVGDVEQLARQQLFADLEAVISRERDDRVAGDARQDRRGRRRRVDDVVADEEEVLAAAFAQEAGRVEGDPFAVALRHRFHLDQRRVGVVGRGLRERRKGVRGGCGSTSSPARRRRWSARPGRGTRPIPTARSRCRPGRAAG